MTDLPAGHNPTALTTASLYAFRHQWLSPNDPPVPPAPNGFWGHEVWSGRTFVEDGSTGRWEHAGTRLAWRHWDYDEQRVTQGGDFDAALGGWLFSYQSLVFSPEGYPPTS